MELNETDIKILQGLLEDARFSSRQIAKKVGVSVGTVLARIKKMEREGIIKRYSALLDHEKLGYELTVLTEITVSKGKLVETNSQNPKRVQCLRRNGLNRRCYHRKIQRPRRPRSIHQTPTSSTVH